MHAQGRNSHTHTCNSDIHVNTESPPTYANVHTCVLVHTKATHLVRAVAQIWELDECQMSGFSRRKAGMLAFGGADCQESKYRER